MFIEGRKPRTECLINGKRVFYDACSSNTLENAKKYYKEAFTYMGSGKIMYFDGVKNVYENEHHFFIKK